MDLQELQKQWNMLDERLAQAEVYDKRMIKQMIADKTKSIFDSLYRNSCWNLATIFLIAVALLPWLWTQGIWRHDASFYILEGVCLLGLLMVLLRQGILARFDVTASVPKQLKNVADYKRFYVYEIIVGMPLAIFGIVASLYIEGAFNKAYFIFPGFFAGMVTGYFGWMKHKKTMREIDQNLAELKDFE